MPTYEFRKNKNNLVWTRYKKLIFSPAEGKRKYEDSVGQDILMDSGHGDIWVREQTRGYNIFMGSREGDNTPS